jgi:membrane fusion protein, copper/silver efflux system
MNENRSNAPRWSSRKRLVLSGALVALTGAVAAVAIASSDDDEQASAPAEAGAMPGMEMGGMQMSTDGSVRLTAAQLREFGVTFGTVEQRALHGDVRTVGIVTFDETRIAQVAPKFGGFVERLYVDFTGQPVRAGQPMAEIYSPELVAAQQELLLAAGLDESLAGSSVPGTAGKRSSLAEAARRRLRLWDVSEAQVDQIVRSGQVRRTITLHAPASGVVVEKPVVRGQAVEPGQTLYTIADLSRVWVEAELREGDAGVAREGAAATIELAAFPGRPIAGRVDYVYPTLQAEARTLKARIAIPNPDGRLRPGMYATVRLSTPAGSALTVPSTAVVHTGDRAIVFVDHGGGRLMPHEVELGRAAGDYTEILTGVEPGQRVVTSAQYILDSESNMAEVMKSMIGQMGPGDGGGVGGMDAGGESMEGMDMQGAQVRGEPAGKER